jgi:hypothetical protein
MMNNDLLLLLGGADLEMQTIRDVLRREGVPYVDNNLRWDNALLSSYRSELQSIKDGQIIYGVELREDIIPPDCYQSIDHHNELSNSPCALEQVMEILHLPMNRYEQLVAANDKAYIPGMMEINATNEEIASIRRADRKAQGVTEEEERMAEKAIECHLEMKDDMIIVYALCSRFSPICDRLFPYNKLLIYTDSEWMYYGEGCGRVRELFAVESSLGNIFYGGGEKGYVGVKQNVYNKDEILEMINRIKNI